MNLDRSLRRARIRAGCTGAALLAVPCAALLLGGREAAGFAATFLLALLAALAIPLGLRWSWDRAVLRVQVARSLDWALPAAMSGEAARSLGLGELPADLRLPGVLGMRAGRLCWVPVLGNQRRVQLWEVSVKALRSVGYVELPAGIVSELALLVRVVHEGREVEIHLRTRRPTAALAVLRASKLQRLLTGLSPESIPPLRGEVQRRR